jgi:sulfane dehydrogenase subunit SoxC
MSTNREIISHQKPKGRPDDRQPTSGRLTRRQSLKGSAGLLGGLVLGSLGRSHVAEGHVPEHAVPPDPTKVLGHSSSDYGFRSQFEGHVLRQRVPVKDEAPAASWTPLHDARGIITPSALHFEVHHGGVPVIDPAKHTLIIHGLVERPLKLTLSDLMRFPAVSHIYFLECAGNSLWEWKKPMQNVQQTHGLVSGSEWTGVLLSTLLREVGVKPEATWMIAEGADAARMNRSIPLEKAWDDAVVAYGQNGEALRPEQGYPMRLLLPGWEGNTNIKWLHVLKITDRAYQTREETSKYSDLVCHDGDCTARQFTFVMDAKSTITYPSAQHSLREPGFVEIRGLAWSGRGTIVRVEVSTDGGKHWALAELQQPVLPKALTVFRFPWQWHGKETILQSRCTDSTGYVQPTRAALLQTRGVESFYHYNAIQSWKVASEGSMHNVHVG